MCVNGIIATEEYIEQELKRIIRIITRKITAQIRFKSIESENVSPFTRYNYFHKKHLIFILVSEFDANRLDLNAPENNHFCFFFTDRIVRHKNLPNHQNTYTPTFVKMQMVFSKKPYYIIITSAFNNSVCLNPHHKFCLHNHCFTFILVRSSSSTV